VGGKSDRAAANRNTDRKLLYQINNIKQMETRKIVGQVSPEERDEIQRLFERKNGLAELAKILTADNAELYEKLVKDMGETGTKFQQWWDAKAQQHGWQSHPKGNWEINFQTCDITLVVNE